jgi:hypothetical protein
MGLSMFEYPLKWAIPWTNIFKIRKAFLFESFYGVSQQVAPINKESPSQVHIFRTDRCERVR